MEDRYKKLDDVYNKFNKAMKKEIEYMNVLLDNLREENSVDKTDDQKQKDFDDMNHHFDMLEPLISHLIGNVNKLKANMKTHKEIVKDISISGE